MAMYSTNNRLAGTQQALTTTFKTIQSLTAATATLCRGQIIELAYGADGAPNATDCNIVYDVSRQTAAGSSTAATPNPVNPSDVASRTVASVNFTAEPTITAASSIWTRTLNQRASQQWYANPGSELVWPATNIAGLAFRSLSPTYTGNVLVETKHTDL